MVQGVFTKGVQTIAEHVFEGVQALVVASEDSKIHQNACNFGTDFCTQAPQI